MYIMVGIAEHVVIVETTPYEPTMFGGKVVVTSHRGGPVSLVAGGIVEVDDFFEAWENETRATKEDPTRTPKLADLLRSHDVAYFQYYPQQRSTVMYYRNTSVTDGIDGRMTPADTPFTFCHSDDQNTHLVNELKLAVMDFYHRGERSTSEILYGIAQFVRAMHTTLEEPGSVRYVNLITGDALAVVDSDNEPTALN